MNYENINYQTCRSGLWSGFADRTGMERGGSAGRTDFGYGDQKFLCVSIRQGKRYGQPDIEKNEPRSGGVSVAERVFSADPASGQRKYVYCVGLAAAGLDRGGGLLWQRRMDAAQDFQGRKGGGRISVGDPVSGSAPGKAWVSAGRKLLSCDRQ